jgi:hypothetical protein
MHGYVHIEQPSWPRNYIGETGFIWHTFHFLISYNFHTNETKNKMVLVARVILRLCKKCNEEVTSVTNPKKRNFF